MITFGYKNRFSGLIRAFLALAVGVVMVVSKTNALELAVRIISACDRYCYLLPWLEGQAEW